MWLGVHSGTFGDMDVADEPTWTYSRRVPEWTPGRMDARAYQLGAFIAISASRPSRCFYLAAGIFHKAEDSERNACGAKNKRGWC